MPTKLGNICLIPFPHSDPQFQYYSECEDSWIVPIEEISYNKNEPLDEGKFGVVYKGKFRGGSTHSNIGSPQDFGLLDI